MADCDVIPPTAPSSDRCVRRDWREGRPAKTELEQIFSRSRSGILAILDDSLLPSEIDVGTLCFNATAVPLHLVINSALEQVRAFAESRKVALALQPPGPQLFLGDSMAGDSNLLVRAIQGLLGNRCEVREDRHNGSNSARSHPRDAEFGH